MRFLRPLALILLAACLGTAWLSALAFHEVSRASFVALPFAVLGTAVVATGCGRLVEAGWVRWFAYILTAGLGAVLGAALLTLPAGPDALNMLAGLVYGGGCAVTWILLDILVPRPARAA